MAQPLRTSRLRAMLSIARGDLIAAERDAEEAWNYGEAHRLPWNLHSAVACGAVAFLRGKFADAERWFTVHTETEGKTYLSGWSDACLFALWAESDTKGNAESNSARAWKAWMDRRWKSPQPGQPNPWAHGLRSRDR